MKRLRRIIFNGLTVLSLLLCVATAGLWVRSYKTPDIFEHYCATKAMLNGEIEESKSFSRLASSGGRVLLNVRQGHGPQDTFGWIGIPPNTINPREFIDDWKWHHDSTMIRAFFMMMNRARWPGATGRRTRRPVFLRPSGSTGLGVPRPVAPGIFVPANFRRRLDSPCNFFAPG